MGGQTLAGTRQCAGDSHRLMSRGKLHDLYQTPRQATPPDLRTRYRAKDLGVAYELCCKIRRRREAVRQGGGAFGTRASEF